MMCTIIISYDPPMYGETQLIIIFYDPPMYNGISTNYNLNIFSLKCLKCA